MESSCPHLSCVHSSFQGLANGLSYGAKVRFTHSLVMAILFSNESFTNKMIKILKNTQDHSSKLGAFVFVFKSFVCILTKLRQKSDSANHALSGLITGVLWSKDTPVNSQITFYLFSRCLVGYSKILHKEKFIRVPDFILKNIFCILTVTCWGIVMMIFEAYPEKLQNSLTSSMKFLYHDSDNWRGWRHCVPYYNEITRLIKIKG